MVIYLSGSVRHEMPPEIGVMMTPMMGNHVPDNRTWAADTGCFAAPHKHDDARYLTWLTRWSHLSAQCLFATAPDVYGDCVGTMERSLPFLPRIRECGYKAALVAQDGFECIEMPWDTFDAIFVGGTDTWRMGYAQDALISLIHEARQRGKWCHLGRVNSLSRLQFARRAGFHSADGTYLAFGPTTNLPKLIRWMNHLSMQPDLFTYGE